MLYVFYEVFVCKQKTAYEMRISDWSSDVCSSDLHGWLPRQGRDRLRVPIGVGQDGSPVELDLKESAENGMGPHGLCIGATGSGKSEFLRTRSEERRAGKEGVSTGRSRWAPIHENKKIQQQDNTYTSS